MAGQLKRLEFGLGNFQAGGVGSVKVRRGHFQSRRGRGATNEAPSCSLIALDVWLSGVQHFAVTPQTELLVAQQPTDRRRAGTAV